MFVMTKVVKRSGSKDSGHSYSVEITDGHAVASFYPKSETDPLSFNNFGSAETDQGTRCWKCGEEIVDIASGERTTDLNIIEMIESCYGIHPKFIFVNNAHTYFI